MKIHLKIKAKGLFAIQCCTCGMIYGIKASKTDKCGITSGMCTPCFKQWRETLKEKYAIPA